MSLELIRLKAKQLEEKMRNELDRLGVGSKLNTLQAQDTRAEMQRYLDSAIQVGNSSQRDLAALLAERDGYIQSWHADKDFSVTRFDPECFQVDLGGPVGDFSGAHVETGSVPRTFDVESVEAAFG